MLRLVRFAALLSVALPLLAGCGPGGVLGSVTLSPPTISPNAASRNRVANLTYDLSRRADITVAFTGPDGVTRTLRNANTRAPGPYSLQFDGTYGGHVLPDGVYRWQVTASDPTSRAVLDRKSATLTIKDAETTGPEIGQSLVFPNPFHPNGNLATDTATFTYTLSKPAQVTIYAVGPTGSPGAQRYEVLDQDAEQAGPHQATWTGQISPEQFIPDGSYAWTIEAKDAAGNVASAHGTVGVTESGIPDARIEDVRATEVQRGGQRLVQVQVRIYNYGYATLTGDKAADAPQQGFTYGSLSASYLMPPPYGTGWKEEAFGRAGTYSVGASFLERDATTEVPYPFRWSIGDDLKTRQTRVITGYIAIPPDYHGKLSFYAGIIHEGQGILSGQDHILADQKLVIA